MKNLTAAAAAAEKKIEQAGIPTENFSAVYRAADSGSWLGCCTIRLLADGKTAMKDSSGKRMFVISVNRILLDDSASDRILEETLVHEILHACAWEDGHGGKWKFYAVRMNRIYGMNIACRAGEDELAQTVFSETRRRSAKYVMKCRKCGHEEYRDRTCPLVEHPEKFSHRDCGGTFIRIR